MVLSLLLIRRQLDLSCGLELRISSTFPWEIMPKLSDDIPDSMNSVLTSFNLKQLEKTNANLIRINDLVKELEGRIEPLHEQSSLAKEYKFQKEQLDHKLKQLLGSPDCALYSFWVATSYSRDCWCIWRSVVRAKSNDNHQQEVEEQLDEAQKVLTQLKKQGQDLVLKRKQLNETIATLDRKIAEESNLTN